jgi:hypothetical protein
MEKGIRNVSPRRLLSRKGFRTAVRFRTSGRFVKDLRLTRRGADAGLSPEGRFRPTLGRLRPTNGPVAPIWGTDAPTLGPVRPLRDLVSPPFGPDRPSFGADRPIHGAVRPLRDLVSPSFGPAGPTLGTGWPKHGPDRPKRGRNRNSVRSSPLKDRPPGPVRLRNAPPRGPSLPIRGPLPGRPSESRLAFVAYHLTRHP